MTVRPGFLAGCVLAAVAAVGCGERQTIGQRPRDRLEVQSLRFEGVRSVSEARLRDLLATKPPSGTSSAPRYFDRDAFRKDLARIVAFYNDLGYPDARIVSFEVDLDLRSETVDLYVAIDEGEPLDVRDGELEASDA